MTKPEDIPEWAWEKGRDLAGSVSGLTDAYGAPYIDEMADIIARVFVAERERCARIADEHSKSAWGGLGGATVAMRTCAESIATAIRNGGGE